tara:strand:- start:270 stop:431 length:162 start_codon:yes stop_codon:yes gene_type:complete
MVDEIKLIDTTLSANLKLLKMINNSNTKEKEKVVLGIAIELKKFCNQIIKIYS